MIGKVLVEFCQGSGEITFAAELDGFCNNCVLIVVVENDDVLGAAAGGLQEATSLVAENPAGDGHRFGETHYGFGRWHRERWPTLS